METSKTLLEMIQVSPDSDGATLIRIPPEVLYECVECFAENRLDARFSFRPPNFVARIATPFERACETLRNWHMMRNEKPVEVGS